MLFMPLAQKVMSRRGALVGLALFAFSDYMIFYSSEVKQYSLELAMAMALSLATLHVLERPVSGLFVGTLALGAIAAPWFSFSSAFIVAGCGLALFLSSLSSARPRAAAFWGVIGLAWAASFVVAYNLSLSMLTSTTTMYHFWNFAFLPIWPLPMTVERTYKTIGILLEVFVNPLNMVHPLWLGVLLPLMALLIGTYALARRSWAACLVFVVPILLAMLASALHRYPFHGRLILELVPALYILIALGTERLGSASAVNGGLGYKVLLVVLIGYPCLVGVSHVALKSPRDFNQHGDLHKNRFLYDDEPLPNIPYRQK
jgi:hypothetical protein